VTGSRAGSSTGSGECFIDILEFVVDIPFTKYRGLSIEEVFIVDPEHFYELLDSRGDGPAALVRGHANKLLSDFGKKEITRKCDACANRGQLMIGNRRTGRVQVWCRECGTAQIGQMRDGDVQPIDSYGGACRFISEGLKSGVLKDASLMRTVAEAHGLSKQARRRGIIEFLNT
jgi:hypothetical protein